MANPLAGINAFERQENENPLQGLKAFSAKESPLSDVQAFSPPKQRDILTPINAASQFGQGLVRGAGGLLTSALANFSPDTSLDLQQRLVETTPRAESNLGFVGESIGNVGLPLGLAAIPGAAFTFGGLGLMGAASTGQGFSEVRQQELETGEDIPASIEYTTALGYGAAEVLTELAPLAFLKRAKALMPRKMASELGQKVLKKDVKGAAEIIQRLTDTGVAGVSEGAQEVSTEVLQNSIARTLFDEDREILNEEGLLRSGLAGTIGGLFVGGIRAGRPTLTGDVPPDDRRSRARQQQLRTETLLPGTEAFEVGFGPRTLPPITPEMTPEQALEAEFITRTQRASRPAQEPIEGETDVSGRDPAFPNRLTINFDPIMPDEDFVPAAFEERQRREEEAQRQRQQEAESVPDEPRQANAPEAAPTPEVQSVEDVSTPETELKPEELPKRGATRDQIASAIRGFVGDKTEFTGTEVKEALGIGVKKIDQGLALLEEQGFLTRPTRQRRWIVKENVENLSPVQRVQQRMTRMVQEGRKMSGSGEQVGPRSFTTIMRVLQNDSELGYTVGEASALLKDPIGSESAVATITDEVYGGAILNQIESARTPENQALLTALAEEGLTPEEFVSDAFRLFRRAPAIERRKLNVPEIRADVVKQIGEMVKEDIPVSRFISERNRLSAIDQLIEEGGLAEAGIDNNLALLVEAWRDAGGLRSGAVSFEDLQAQYPFMEEGEFRSFLSEIVDENQDVLSYDGDALVVNENNLETQVKNAQQAPIPQGKRETPTKKELAEEAVVDVEEQPTLEEEGEKNVSEMTPEEINELYGLDPEIETSIIDELEQEDQYDVYDPESEANGFEFQHTIQSQDIEGRLEETGDFKRVKFIGPTGKWLTAPEGVHGMIARRIGTDVETMKRLGFVRIGRGGSMVGIEMMHENKPSSQQVKAIEDYLLALQGTFGPDALVHTEAFRVGENGKLQFYRFKPGQLQTKVDAVFETDFQPTSVGQLINERKLKALVETLKSTGLVKDVIFSEAQLTDFQGNPVNGMLAPDGTVFLSPSIQINTIGHEAFHALVRAWGKKHPLIAEGLNLFNGDIEALADAVGDFYASRVMPKTMFEKIRSWLRKLWDFVSRTEPSPRDYIAQALARGITEFRADQVPTDPTVEFQRVGVNPQRAFFGLSDVDAQVREIVKEVNGQIESAPRREISDLDRRMQRTWNTEEKMQKKVESLLKQAAGKDVEQLGLSPVEQRLVYRTMSAFSRRLFRDIQNAPTKKEAEQIRKFYVDNYFQHLVKFSQASSLGLNAYRNLIDDWRDTKHITEADIDTLTAVAKDMSEGDYDRAQRRIQEMKPRVQDYFWQVYYNSLLSGPPTHLVNILSTTAWFGLSFPEHAMKGLVDKMGAVLTGKKREFYLREMLPRMAGAIEGVSKGGKEAKHVLLTGRTTDELMDRWEFEMGSGVIHAFENSPNPFLRKIAPLISFPSRLMRMLDVMVNSMAYQSAVRGQAVRAALQQNVPPSEMNKFVQNFQKNMSKEQYEEALKFARRATFMDEPGKFRRALIQMRNNSPGGIMRLVLPFINTISNVALRGIEFTPGLGLTSPILEGKPYTQKEVTEMMARQIMGSMALLAISMALDEEEDITGAIPRNPAEREAFFRQGKLPFAAKLNGEWIQYNRLEPFGFVLGAAKSFTDAARNDDLETATDRFMHVSFALGNFMSNSTWAENLGNIFEEYGFKKTAARSLAGLVPYSNLFRQMRRGQEAMETGEVEIPISQQILFDQMAQVIPGLGANTPARLSVWGEEVTIPGGVFRQWLPYKWSQMNYDDVEQELERLEIYPGMPRQTMDLNGEEVEIPLPVYRDYVIMAGRLTKFKLESIVKSPAYQRAPDKIKADIINRAILSSRNTLRGRLRSQVRLAIRRGEVALD